MKETQEKLIICTEISKDICTLDNRRCEMLNGYRCVPREKRRKVKQGGIDERQ